MKQREQVELAQSVMTKVTKELENPKVLQQILQQSVADVESKYAFRSVISCNTNVVPLEIVSSKAQ